MAYMMLTLLAAFGATVYMHPILSDALHTPSPVPQPSLSRFDPNLNAPLPFFPCSPLCSVSRLHSYTSRSVPHSSASRIVIQRFDPGPPHPRYLLLTASQFSISLPFTFRTLWDGIVASGVAIIIAVTAFWGCLSPGANSQPVRRNRWS